MDKSKLKFNISGKAIVVLALFASLLMISACTTNTNSADTSAKDQQISTLQSQAAAKDQQISTLQSQINSLQNNQNTQITKEEADFKLAMRKLWEDHIIWTRLYIVEFSGNLSGKNATAARLLKNQEDIGNAIKSYYGTEAGDKLTALLKTHIQGAVDILSAAKAGNKTMQDAATAQWYNNGDEIAVFLSAANPGNWPEADMKSEMKMHLDLTLEEAVAELTKDYSQSVSDYDDVHNHILEFADTLSSGIINQFPSQFGK